MKNFIKGVLVTLVIEAIIIMWNTCSVQVTTNYNYDPQAIIAMMPDATSYTTTK